MNEGSASESVIKMSIFSSGITFEKVTFPSFLEFANIIDSYIFFFTAFLNSDDIYMSENWIEIAGTQSLIKIVIGLIFFLPIYGILLKYLVKKFKKK